MRTLSGICPTTSLLFENTVWRGKLFADELLLRFSLETPVAGKDEVLAAEVAASRTFSRRI
jgi:hypothetical protein